MIRGRGTVRGYTWGTGCRAWPLVETDTLSVKEEEMPPGTAETPHLHRRSRQFFYILEGTAFFETKEETAEVRAGEGMEIAPGMRHRIQNRSAETLRFLVISEPPASADRIEEKETTGTAH